MADRFRGDDARRMKIEVLRRERLANEWVERTQTVLSTSDGTRSDSVALD